MGNRANARVLSAWLLSLLIALAFAAGCGRSVSPQEQGVKPDAASPQVSADQARTAPFSGAAQPLVASDATGSSPQLAFDRLVIRTADLALQVRDVGQALVAVRQLTVDAGGFVMSSTTYSDGENEANETAVLAVQVPFDRFDQFLNQLRSNPLVVKVDRDQVQSQDVTEEYLDLDARLRNLQATERRYLALLERASTIEEILRVEQELSRVRYEIEQVTGRKQYLERRTQYAQATITLTPAPALEQRDGPVFDFARAVERAWNASLRFLGGIAELVVMVVVFLWWLWPVVALLGVLGLRWRGRRQAAKTTG